MRFIRAFAVASLTFDGDWEEGEYKNLTNLKSFLKIKQQNTVITQSFL